LKRVDYFYSFFSHFFFSIILYYILWRGIVLRRKNKYKKNTSALKVFFSIILIILISIYGFICLDAKIKPAVFNIAEMRVREIATKVVNESVYEEFAQNINYGDLVQIETDHQGKIISLQANTVLMNTLAADMTLMIQNNIQNVTSYVQIPIGSIMGSQILSQYGPMISLKIIPIGMAKVNFKTEFEDCGINQTRHKIFLEVETYAKIIVPFNTDTINIQTIVPIAETIIVGEVPQSYIFIPENETPNIIQPLR